MLPQFIRNIIESKDSSIKGVVALAIAAGILVFQLVVQGQETLSDEAFIATLGLVAGGIFGLFKKDKDK